MIGWTDFAKAALPMTIARCFPLFGSIGAVMALVLAPMVPSPAAAQGAGFADLPQIDREVAVFAGHEIGQQGGAVTLVDRRLRLARCHSPLALSWRLPRRDTIIVECPDPGSWHLFVPIRAGDNAPMAVAVARGEGVMIAVTGDGFTVSQSGEAMDAGALGDWIRVRAVRDGSPKGEPMRAKIVRPGQVELELP